MDLGARRPWLLGILGLAGLLLMLALDPLALPLYQAAARHEWVATLTQAFREFGGMTGATIILVMALMLDPPRKRWIAAAWVAVAVAYLSIQPLKLISGRMRPDSGSGPFVFTGPTGLRAQDQGKSFPSGHSAQAFALATVLARAYPHARRGFYLVALGCAVSRVVDGRHFPSDIYAGALFGLSVAHLLLVFLAGRLSGPGPGAPPGGAGSPN